jgi:hypothetical protein
MVDMTTPTFVNDPRLEIGVKVRLQIKSPFDRDLADRSIFEVKNIVFVNQLNFFVVYIKSCSKGIILTIEEFLGSYELVTF